MNQMSNEDFIDFIEKYSPEYLDTITNISWPRLENGKKHPKRDPLIKNNLKMLSLDDICKDCTKFEKDNRPTTTDALWYKMDENDNITLYFIEFKWHNLDKKKDQSIFKNTFLDLINGTKITEDMLKKFDKLYKNYIDEDVICKLRLKPFESIFIVLPMLYNEYCEKNPNVEHKDLDTFLKNCNIKVYSFVSDFSETIIKINKKDEEKILQKKSVNPKKSMEEKIDQSKNSARRRFQERSNYNRFSGHTGSIGSTIEKQYKRLVLTTMIDFARVSSKSSFDEFLKIEGLINQEY